jgi:phage baseplate assembly protein W
MARPIYRLEPFNTTPDVAIGVKLPFNVPASSFSVTSNYASGSADAGSVFVQSYSTLDQAISNIKSLLLTRRGERFMQPTLGTGLFDVLFENLTNEVVAEAQESIRDNLAFWLPYVNLNNLSIREDRQRGYLHFSFDISIETLGANVVINMLLDGDTVLDIQVEEEVDAIGGVTQLVPISSAPVTSPGTY